MGEDIEKTIVMNAGELQTASYGVCAFCGGAMALDEEAGQLRCSACGQEQSAPVELKPGVILGRYRLLKELGAGGMGSIFLCAPLDDANARLALKVIRTAAAADKVAISRFVREARVMGALDHPNIVHLVDAWSDRSIRVIVMEYVDGITLSKVVKDQYGIAMIDVIQLMRICVGAFSYAWEKLQLLHRDIKPSNIMIDKEGNVKILDFGIAKRLDAEESLALTAPGSTVGSPGFMSLEQFQDSRKAGVQSDIYSLGATIYFVLTGRPPFDGDNPLMVLDYMLKNDVVPVEQLRPDVPADLADLLGRMLARNAAERPQSWQELAAELETIYNANVQS
ncbi:MAG: serine/threonine protein kinase [Lentisphaeria bacterium]|nr:serine/threonine protein kinase [Lentisphaeria bacterium]